MESAVNKVLISKKTDNEILNLIYSEFMRIKPKNYQEFYEKSCLPTNPVLQKRFKMKYTDILVKAGIPTEMLNIKKTNEYYINRLKNLAEKLGHAPSIKELKVAGYDQTVYIYRFGSYNKALEKSGLTPKKAFKKKEISKKQMILDYKRLSEKLGRPATEIDFNRAGLSYSTHVVLVRFGSFNALKEKAGYEKENRGSGRRTFTKGIILKMLTKEYISKKRSLALKELKNKENWPSINTIEVLFQKTNMSEVWSEVAQNAISTLNRRVGVGDKNEKIIRAGIAGENNVAHNLGFLNPHEYKVFNNINIYSEIYHKNQQIDHLVIGPNGIFAIETKHLNGRIVVQNNNTWEQYTTNGYNKIENPTQQVIRHESILKSILPEKIPLTSVIAMGSYFTEVDHSDLCEYPIVNANMILQYIKNYGSRELTNKEIKKVVNIIKRNIIPN